MHGRRTVRGGRRQLRAVLFVVAGVVSRHNPDFAAFHQRLSAAGKPKKVIRIALAHKLLVRLNAKARDVRIRFEAANAISTRLTNRQSLFDSAASHPLPKMPGS